jgi:PilZ domain-containing protein
MPDRKGEEKREFVRTDLSIQATVAPIDRNEPGRKLCLKQIFSSDPDEGDAPDASNATKHAIYDLAEFLIQINKKIDRITDFLGIDPSDAGLLQVIRTLNISGSGISLVITHPLEIGQLLDVSLSIPVFPLGVFRGQGEVMRNSRLAGKESHLYEAGIRFLDLNDEQREMLISFTFRQQRKAIRQRKNYS